MSSSVNLVPLIVMCVYYSKYADMYSNPKKYIIKPDDFIVSSGLKNLRVAHYPNLVLHLAPKHL